MTSLVPPRPRKARHAHLLAAQRNAGLQALLRELAVILVSRGVTPKQFAELSKRAFVHAAADIARFGTGRVNQSRVAVLTGLSRAEVKELLPDERENPIVNTSIPSRIERIIHGWRTDARFCDERGPKKLTISGRLCAFARLVRAYGGDVPHRAVLDELRRIEAVRESGSSIVLNRDETIRERQELSGLTTVVPVLIDSLHLASQEQDLRKGGSIRRLTLSADDPVELAIVRDRCTTAVKAMLRGLSESLGVRPSTAARKKESAESSCTITVLLVENKEIQVPSRTSTDRRSAAVVTRRARTWKAARTRRSK